MSHALLIDVPPLQSPKVLSKQTRFLNFLKFFWIRCHLSLRVVNDMGNCVPHSCHSLHPIDWELNTQERAVGRVTEYLWWWLQPINFDGCHLIEKTMRVETTATHQHMYITVWRRESKMEQWPYTIDFWVPMRPLVVTECHIREADSGSQDAKAGFPCDLWWTARTRGSKITRNVNDVLCAYVLLVLPCMWEWARICKVNETKAEPEIDCSAWLYQCELSGWLSPLPLSNQKCSLAKKGHTPFVCGRYIKIKHAGNLTLKLLHRDYGQLAKGKKIHIIINTVLQFSTNTLKKKWISPHGNAILKQLSYSCVGCLQRDTQAGNPLGGSWTCTSITTRQIYESQ